MLIFLMFILLMLLLILIEFFAVTCIQFNPIDDRYFISGSLDAKVRIWSVPDRQVVDWTDLHEMVTAACYTPDGQVQPNDICAHSTLSILYYLHFYCTIYPKPVQLLTGCIHVWKGALVGSHKGSFRLYKTTGMNHLFKFLNRGVVLFCKLILKDSSHND